MPTLTHFWCTPLWVIGLVAGSVAAKSPAQTPVTIDGQTMGTTYRVKLAAVPAGVSEQTMRRAIEQTLHHLNDLMSTYQPDTEISRFNRFTGAGWFAVSPATATVVAAAIRLSRATGGAFDPTVGPLVSLWSFGPEPRTYRIPEPAELARVRESIGYEKIQIRRAPPALRKQRAGVQLDLSAIAKGYAVDRVAELLHERGVRGYLVEIGGEARVGGSKADGRPWVLGIEAPMPGRRSVWRAIQVTDASLATSGDYRNFFQVDGQRYAHMIDPRTGHPVAHSAASVSVIDRACMRADALATALAVLGPDVGYQFALDHRLAALFILRVGDQLVERPTPAFAEVARQPGDARRWLRWGSRVTAGLVLAAVTALAAVTMLVRQLRRRPGRESCRSLTSPHEPPPTSRRA